MVRFYHSINYMCNELVLNKSRKWMRITASIESVHSLVEIIKKKRAWHYAPLFPSHQLGHGLHSHHNYVNQDSHGNHGVPAPAAPERNSLDLGHIPHLQQQIRATSELCLQVCQVHLNVCRHVCQPAYHFVRLYESIYRFKVFKDLRICRLKENFLKVRY